MPIKLSIGPKKRIGSPRNQLGGHKSMKRVNRIASRLKGFSSGASLGGEVSHYRNKQNIYKQGAPAYTLFYIQEGGVRLTTKKNHQPAGVTAILGAPDFFGEFSLAGYPRRMCTAVALTAADPPRGKVPQKNRALP